MRLLIGTPELRFLIRDIGILRSSFCAYSAMVGKTSDGFLVAVTICIVLQNSLSGDLNMSE